MTCLFCDIAIKKISSYVVYEDEATLAFLDIKPLSLGHTVIIPKTHAGRITALPKDLAPALGLTIKRVSDILHQSVKPDGFTIGINDGTGGRQGVPHVHVHVIPRWNSDNGGNLHSIVQNPPNMPLEEAFKRIQSLSNQTTN